MNHIMQKFILPGLAYLPKEMDTPGARAMLFAVGCQEGMVFTKRHQIGGPAHGFWQFEKGGGVKGVLTHPATADYIKKVCEELVIKPTVNECFEAIVYNDPLACCFARLLLWTLPDALPKMDEYQKGWSQYISAWRPGKPHEESWKSYFNTAWLSV